MIQICKALIDKINLVQFSTKRRLVSILKDEAEDSNEKIARLNKFMGNDANMDEDDRNCGVLFLCTLEAWIRGSKYLIQKKILGKEMVQKKRLFLKAHLCWKICPLEWFQVK